MQADNAVRQFRRTTRRLAAQFIAGKIDRDAYLAAVRRAALAAELIVSDGKRNRADTILDVLAWSNNALAPGELPAALEPYFEQFHNEAIDFGALRARVIDLVARASQRPNPSP